jgi:hypothetical protein
MNDRKKFLKELKRFGEDRQELATYKTAEPELRAEADAALTRLERSGGARVLLTAAGKSDEELPEDVRAPLAALRSAQLKLELLPRVLRQLNADLVRQQGELEKANSALLAECRGKARQAMEDLRVKTQAEWLPLCGGDQERARTAAEAAVVASEAARWLQHLAILDSSSERQGDPAERFRRCAEAVERFEAGQPVTPT